MIPELAKVIMQVRMRDIPATRAVASLPMIFKVSMAAIIAINAITMSSERNAVSAGFFSAKVLDWSFLSEEVVASWILCFSALRIWKKVTLQTVRLITIQRDTEELIMVVTSILAAFAVIAGAP